MKKSKLTQLLAFDTETLKNLEQQGLENIALVGVDEVGRGSMIGPVTAAAACLPAELLAQDITPLEWLNDSKQIPEKRREALSEWLFQNAMVTVAHAKKEEVDRLNVHHASLLALYRAYQNLLAMYPDYFKGKTPYVLIDGRAKLPELSPQEQQTVIKGDGKSAVIAAASVVAKTIRDNLIRDYAKQYPEYSWDTNMGYPTPAHKEILIKLGVTPLHRCNYKPVQNQLNLLLKY